MPRHHTLRSAYVSRMITAVLIASGLEHFVVSAQRAPERRSNGVLLENLTWVEAKDRLVADGFAVGFLGSDGGMGLVQPGQSGVGQKGALARKKYRAPRPLASVVVAMPILSLG